MKDRMCQTYTIAASPFTFVGWMILVSGCGPRVALSETHHSSNLPATLHDTGYDFLLAVATGGGCQFAEAHPGLTLGTNEVGQGLSVTRNGDGAIYEHIIQARGTFDGVTYRRELLCSWDGVALVDSSYHGESQQVPHGCSVALNGNGELGAVGYSDAKHGDEWSLTVMNEKSAIVTHTLNTGRLYSSQCMLDAVDEGGNDTDN